MKEKQQAQTRHCHLSSDRGGSRSLHEFQDEQVDEHDEEA